MRIVQRMDVFMLRLAVVPSSAGVTAKSRRRMAIYLRDHLAMLEGAIALVDRARTQNKETPLERALELHALELREDRQHLRAVADAVGVTPAFLKIAAVRLAEWLGRFKLNGQLSGYSPLSRMNELEGLVILAAERDTLWQVLERHARFDPRLGGVDAGFRAELARHQRQRLERELVQASVEAF